MEKVNFCSGQLMLNTWLFITKWNVGISLLAEMQYLLLYKALFERLYNSLVNIKYL